MGWWDSGILDGDEPWDAVGALETAVKWKADEERENSILAAVRSRRLKLRARLKAHLTRPESVLATKQLIQRWRSAKYNASVSVLAVVYVLIDLEVPFDDEVETFALAAVAGDEWGRLGHSGRVEALDDFKARLAAFRHAAPKKKFKVVIQKTEISRAEEVVEAVSAYAARTVARLLYERRRVSWGGKDSKHDIVDVVELP
jgi:hypothetical protein